MKKSLLNLNENIVAALSYFSCIGAFLILILERENKFVKFHAMQSILYNISIGIIVTILAVLSKIPILGLIFSCLTNIFTLVILAGVIYLIYMAFKGREFRLPIIGDICYNQINK